MDLPMTPLRPLERRWFVLLLAAMAVVVTASNILVQHPIHALGLQDWLTWGALTYPFAFLVTDLANRRFGAVRARHVVALGFVLAVLLSVWLATPRIAIASGTAFLVAQLVDIGVFDRLRARVWWLAPLVSSLIASAIDTALFFSLAFHCGSLPLVGVSLDTLLAAIGIRNACDAGMPWQTLAIADFGVKVALALAALLPYGLITRTRLVPSA
jgi:uncharacterized PurR-regulated membrane protein YhhQ (DUF165 family)